MLISSLFFDIPAWKSYSAVPFLGFAPLAKEQIRHQHSDRGVGLRAEQVADPYPEKVCPENGHGPHENNAKQMQSGVSQQDPLKCLGFLVVGFPENTHKTTGFVAVSTKTYQQKTGPPF